MSLILLTLGSGLGFLSVSPWQDVGTAAKTLGIVGAIYLALTQLIAGALGGYVAGRLRTRWVDVHTDEVYFRDTAHGFLVWAVSVVVTAAFVGSAGTALIGGTAKLGGAALAAGAAGAGTAAASQPMNADATATGSAGNGYASYLADRLLRREPASNATAAAANGAQGGAADNAPSASTTTTDTTMASATTQTSVAPADATTRAEMARLFAVGVRNGDLSPADRAYAASVVARSTGLSQADAERRVDEVVVQAKTTADEARAAADTGRKAAAYFSLWAFASLLLGAFSSSYAATRGGRRRDGLLD
jgi:hypothetical protein